MLHHFKRIRDGVGALPLKSVECEKVFCAWLGLAPRHEISGGKVLRWPPSRAAVVLARLFGSRRKRPGGATVG
jgi:hypothetical protein